MVNKVSFENKKEVRFHKVLSNGQRIGVYVSFNPFDSVYREINVGVCIGSTRRECNDWWAGRSKKNDSKSTGNCGLEGLRFALSCIQYVEDNWLGEGDVIVIGHTDEKRRSAYRFLERHGFSYNEQINEYVKYIHTQGGN